MGYRLLKRENIFYVRVWVPLDVRSILHKQELKKSLRTSCRSDARVLASGLLHKAETLFMQIRSGMLSDRQLENISAELIAEFTGTMEAGKKSRKNAFDMVSEGLPYGLSYNGDRSLIESTFKHIKPIAEVQALSAAYDNRMLLLTEQIVTGLYSSEIRMLSRRMVSEKALDCSLPPASWFNENEPEWFDDPPADFGRLCEQVAAALKTSYQLQQEQVQGRGDTDFRVRTLNRIEQDLPKPKLSDLWSAYREYKLSKGRWNSRSEESYRRFYTESVSIIGDKELAEYPQNVAADFINKLKSIGNTPATITGKIEFLSSLFKFALKTPDSIDSWKVRSNPFAEMQVTSVANGEDGKVAYTVDDLAGILRGLLTVRKQIEPHRFWIPILAMYTGARQAELCQLRTTDIREIDGVLTFCFVNNSAHNQQTKNKHDRGCPVHPMIKRLGFLEYLAGLKQGQVFPALIYSRTKGYTGKVRSWFNEQFQKKYVTDTTGKSFHSLRKSFIDWFKQNKMYARDSDRALLQSMVGHGDTKADVTALHYESDFTPNEQLKLLRKLDYKFDPELIAALIKKKY